MGKDRPREIAEDEEIVVAQRKRVILYVFSDFSLEKAGKYAIVSVRPMCQLIGSLCRFLCAPIAQLVEQLPFKETVPGSNPGGGTKKFIPFSSGGGSAFGGKETVPGSNPGGGTNIKPPARV